MSAVRRFLLYAWLSYRALFTWLNPWGYISSRMAMPIALALIFGGVGRYVSGSATRPVVGAAMLAIALGTLYGINLAVANERVFGTLGLWLAAPQPLLPSLLGKAACHVLDALLGATLTLVTAMVAFDVRIAAGAYAPLLVCAACAAVSTSGLGVAVAAVSVRFRDVLTAPNIAECLLLVGSSTVVVASALPANLGAIGAVLPLRRAVEAAHQVAAGGALPVGLLCAELAVGAAWAVAGYGFLQWMAARARSAAAYDFL